MFNLARTCILEIYIFVSIKIHITMRLHIVIKKIVRNKTSTVKYGQNILDCILQFQLFKVFFTGFRCNLVKKTLFFSLKNNNLNSIFDA